MHNLLKVTFLVLAAFLAQVSLADVPIQPGCLTYVVGGNSACRVDAAVAPIEDKFFAWGGRETRGCPNCDRRQIGVNSGGLYDQTGTLIEAFPTLDGPGPRYGAQAFWNREALFIWGGVSRQEEHRLVSGAYEVRATEYASVNSLYLPGARRWIRMSTIDAPPILSKLEAGPGGHARACWTEAPVPPATTPAVFCRVFDMPHNTWGPKLPRD